MSHATPMSHKTHVAQETRYPLGYPFISRPLHRVCTHKDHNTEKKCAASQGPRTSSAAAALCFFVCAYMDIQTQQRRKKVCCISRKVCCISRRYPLRGCTAHIRTHMCSAHICAMTHSCSAHICAMTHSCVPRLIDMCVAESNKSVYIK